MSSSRSNSRKNKPCAVIGVGNFLLSDEGAGIHAVDLLRDANLSGKADIIDGATAGPGLRFFLENRERVIFVDAGNFGGRPGEYIRFGPDDVRTNKQQDGFSLHEFDLVAYLQNLDSEENIPENITVFCIQPMTVEPGNTLSPPVAEGLRLLVDEICRELEN
jgi:hydrogenase maturation protease